MDNNLLNYLENIITLEKTAFTQEKIIYALDVNIKKLCIPTKIERRRVDESSFTESLGSSSGIGFTLGAVVGLFTAHGDLIEFLAGMIEAGIYGSLCGLVIGIIVGINQKLKDNSEKALAEQEYLDAKAREHRRICSEKKQAEQLMVVKNELIVKNRQTQSLLQEYYSKNILYGAYQNITAVCSIYEYLKSGKCSQLQGHEGAYVLYDHERRLDRIVEGLDRISVQLEQIKHNQFMMYSAFQEANRTLTHIENELNEQVRLQKFNAAQNSIIAYNTAVAAKELHMSNWLKRYELDKAGMLPFAWETRGKNIY